MTRSKNNSAILLGLGVCALALSACQTASSNAPGPQQERADSVQAAIERKDTGGGVSKPLDVAERAYKKNPEDMLIATDYARALRENGSPDQAALILEPLSKRDDVLSYTLSEYAAVFLMKGDSVSAEKFAQKAVLKDGTNYRAYHNLGLALETQGKHPEAERAFRKGIELWQGDPTTIMNNLALNLSAQGYLDEAIDILRRAQSIAPDRIEIERNLRIVTALQQAARGPTPKPPKKPAS